MIQVGIASMSERNDALTDCLNSLLNQSVKPDRITVYLQQGHPCVFKHPSVELIHHKGKYLGDAHKFHRAGQSEGFFFACDDDLIYSKGYIKGHLSKLDKYNGIVGLHGVIMKPKPEHYYSDRRVLHGLTSRDKDTSVHLVATCSCAWDMSEVGFSFKDCTEPGMADIWLGLYAQKYKIASTAIAYPKDWVRHSDKVNLGKTIYAKESRNRNYVGNKYIGIDWKVYD